MKTTILFHLTLFVIILSITACESFGNTTSQYMAFDQVIYVDQFPQTFTLEKGTLLEIPVIGVKNFVIRDSLFIAAAATTKGFWSILSLPNLNNLGSFIGKGNGPNEFAWPPSLITGTNFYKENGLLYARIYDSSKGRLYCMDIDGSIQANRLKIDIINDSLPKNLFSFVMLDSTTLFCREISPQQTQQNRYLLRNNKKTIPESFEKLNKVTLRKGENCNILSSITKYNDRIGLLLEMPIGLNHLNLYSPDGTFEKTICIGKQVDNIDKIQSTKRWNRLYTFADVRLYDSFFGVLRINESDLVFQTKRSRLPEIMLFDWDGNPIAEIKSDRFITAFEFDLHNRNLYTIDHQTDEIVKYDVGHIIEKIRKTAPIID